MVQGAIADAYRRRDDDTQQEHDRIEASWRERALNAENALTSPALSRRSPSTVSRSAS